MSADNEVLWVVEKRKAPGVFSADIERVRQRLLFRTRAAANAYVRGRQKPKAAFSYVVRRATWGPEQ